MKRASGLRRLVPLIAVLAVAVAVPAARAAGLGGLNSRLAALEPRVDEALANPSVASDVIQQLDMAEGEFEQIANSGRAGRGELLEAYMRLESMLNRLYTAYQRKKDACIAQIDAGGH